jgi:metal-sulfur cluster biosynthetic enzyme
MRAWPPAEDHAEPLAEAEPFADVPTDEHGMPTEDALREALRAVLDPEIGINIIDLGLVYGVRTEPPTDDRPGRAHVTMTLTSMGCPLTELLHQQCTLVLARLPGIDDVDVDFTFTPPWSTDMISVDAREELRAMGFNV